MMETLWQDLKYGIRMLRRSPAFALLALLSLALGIGANTAIFSMINAIMLKALPVKNPNQVALFAVHYDGPPGLSFSYPLFERFRDNKKVFDGVMATGGAVRMHMTISGGGSDEQSELVQVEKVTGNYFSVLGVNPILGSLLTEEDDRANSANSVAVISYHFWKNKFGLNPDVVGKAIVLNDVPLTII